MNFSGPHYNQKELKRIGVNFSDPHEHQMLFEGHWLSFLSSLRSNGVKRIVMNFSGPHYNQTRIKILVPSECDSRIIVVHHLLSVFDNFSDSRVIVVQQLHSGFDNF